MCVCVCVSHLLLHADCSLSARQEGSREEGIASFDWQFLMIWCNFAVFSLPISCPAMAHMRRMKRFTVS